jgi:hypothetical protein
VSEMITLPARTAINIEIDRAWWAMVTAPSMELRVSRMRRLLALRQARASQ